MLNPTAGFLASGGRPIQGVRDQSARRSLLSGDRDLGDGAGGPALPVGRGQALDVAIQPLAQGDLPGRRRHQQPGCAPSPISTARSSEGFSLLAPLAVGIALALMLMLPEPPGRRPPSANSSTSEQRFRLAVEAARCGISEWELARRPGVHVLDVDRRDVRLGRRRRSAGAGTAGPRRARPPRQGPPGPGQRRHLRRVRRLHPACLAQRAAAPSGSTPAAKRFGKPGEDGYSRDHRRGAGRHRGTPGPGPRPGRREPPARRQSSVSEALSSGTARAVAACATATTATSSTWNPSCSSP